MNITLGHDEILIRFGNLVPIFKVTVKLNGSNLRVCGGGHTFSLKTKLVLELNLYENNIGA